MPDLTQAKKLIKECQETQNSYLYLGGCGITDLNELPELLECSHLESLDLFDNQISDISFLSNLTQLQELDLSNNQISNISCLSGLTRLKTLDLRHNKIKEVPKFIFELDLEIDLDCDCYMDEGLFLDDNPIESPPIKVIENGSFYVILQFFIEEEIRPKAEHLENDSERQSNAL